MNAVEMLAVALIGAGVFFFVSGSIGLLRLPDVHTRLHALTKADNVGLGLVVAGLLLVAADVANALRLLLVWLLVLASSAVTAFLIAQAAHKWGPRADDDSH